jgi:hypothetical protein
MKHRIQTSQTSGGRYCRAGSRLTYESQTQVQPSQLSEDGTAGQAQVPQTQVGKFKLVERVKVEAQHNQALVPQKHSMTKFTLLKQVQVEARHHKRKYIKSIQRPN